MDGEAVRALSGQTLEVVEPATGVPYARCPRSGEADIENAVAAAERAFPSWAATPAEERARILLAIADGIDRRREELARAESRDNGKPVSLARALDIPRAAHNFRFFATAAIHFASECHITDGRAINYTLRKPCGVAGLISPWNLPLYLFTWKVAPALAAGDTAVGKPSEVTPYTAHLLAEICAEAGLPRGVLNVVHGLGAEAGQAIIAHPRVPIISFTGGTATGAAIAATAAPLFKKLSLELGGKNPNIVFADADLERAVTTSLRSSFANQGEICLCGSRILVERSIAAEFTERLVAGARGLRVGDPAAEETEVGALVSAAHRDKVAAAIAIAEEEGGRVLCGGGRPRDLPDRLAGGYYIAPTVIEGLSADARTNQEEIFGPVVTVIPFETEQQALEIANGTQYGLSASVWTRDVHRAHRFAERLAAGTVWVNTWMLRDLRVPFGGVRASGVGREGGLESLRFFTEPKNVCVATDHFG